MWGYKYCLKKYPFGLRHTRSKQETTSWFYKLEKELLISGRHKSSEMKKKNTQPTTAGSFKEMFELHTYRGMEI